MLATNRDDTWNVLNMQHITPILKRWEYSNAPGGGHKKIKGPAHMVEGDHHLRKAPNPHPLPEERIYVCILCANLVLVAPIHYKLLHGQAKLPRIMRQNGKNDLEGQGQCPGANDPHFHCKPRVAQDACLVQIWWFKLKSVMMPYCAKKVKFTDTRTDVYHKMTYVEWPNKCYYYYWVENIDLFGKWHILDDPITDIIIIGSRTLMLDFSYEMTYVGWLSNCYYFHWVKNKMSSSLSTDLYEVIIGTGYRVQVLSLILDSSVGLSAGIQSAGDSVPETLLGSNPAFSRGRQPVSFPFENHLPVPEHRN